MHWGSAMELSVTGWNVDPQTIARLISRTTIRPQASWPALMAANTQQPTASDSSPVRLKRALSLWNLIIIGIVIIQPIAPMGIYGVINNEARGHVVTTILIAMVAMLFTAISYGKMARAYPSAGSAYTYVGREIHPALGYVTGWAMVMDYILNPLICTVICSELARNILPGVPYWALAVAFAATVHRAESARHTDLGAHQRSARGGHDDRGGDLFRVRDPLALGTAPVRRGFFHAAVLRSADVQLPRRVSRHLDRRAHLHRLRRASRPFPRKPKIPGAIFCWPRCWSA